MYILKQGRHTLTIKELKGQNKMENLKMGSSLMVEFRCWNEKNKYLVNSAKSLYYPDSLSVKQNLDKIIKEEVKRVKYTAVYIIGHIITLKRARVNFYIYVDQPIDDNIKLMCEVEGRGWAGCPPDDKYNCKSFMHDGLLVYVDISLSSFCDVVADILEEERND